MKSRPKSLKNDNRQNGGPMSNREMLLAEMISAISSYDSGKLTLNGLVKRLEELTAALANTGFVWQLDIEDCLLQMEIINSLILSGDKPSLSIEDISDIGTYLRSIEKEIYSDGTYTKL